MIRAAALAVLALLAACDDGPATGPHAGQPLPAFAADSLAHGRVALPAAGRPLVLSFWATWCGPCRDEMRALEAVWTRYRDRGLVVAAINTGEDAAAVRAFTAGLGVSYPVLIDPGSEITRRHGVTGLPITILVGRDGTIRGRILGPADETALRSFAEGAL